MFHRPHFIIALIGILGLLAVTSARADSVYVEPATGSGLNEGDLDTATQLVKTAVGDVSSDRVVDQPDQADFNLRPNLLKLGAAYVLGLAKVNKNGKTIFSSQLKAQKMDELDKVATRLTRSVIAGTRAKTDAHVGEVTNEEATEGTQRRPARKAWYVGFGGSNLNNLNVSGLGYSIGVAYAWDVNTALIKIMAEGSGLSSAFLASLGLGGDYFLTTSDIAPHVGGDFGFGAAKSQSSGGFFSGQTIGGFDLGLCAGVQFLRTAAVNLDLSFRAGFLLHSNSYGTPEALSLRLGLYF
jgi:hypothetical protein